jgi:hypothetical protein
MSAMINIDEQIRFAKGRIDICESVLKSIDINDFFRGIHTNELQVLNAILETLQSVQCNGNMLPANRKQCPACGEMFTPKNNLQECCDTKCRVRLHRAKNRLKEFNAKVADILKAKDPEAKFTVEQLISSDDKCPFIVDYKGVQYQSDNTRNLLTQLKKI